jgi:four helix bundle protein
MSRDHRKLRVFQLADRAVEAVYRITRTFPASERYGLQAQLGRASVSVPYNIVEGCARRTTAEYVNFVNVATGSAAETAYLIDLSDRLGFVDGPEHEPVPRLYEEIVAGLKALVSSLERAG